MNENKLIHNNLSESITHNLPSLHSSNNYEKIKLENEVLRVLNDKYKEEKDHIKALVFIIKLI